MMEIRKTVLFDKWMKSLRDRRAKARIEVRIRRLSLGNPGDASRLAREGVNCASGKAKDIAFILRPEAKF